MDDIGEPAGDGEDRLSVFEDFLDQLDINEGDDEADADGE